MQYFLATQAQASALFMRFYGRASSKGSPLAKEAKEKEKAPNPSSTESPSSIDLPALASQFASKIPTHTFSTAELQGYLLLHKKAPEDAVGGVEEWVQSELGDRLEDVRKERERKERVRPGWGYIGVPTGPGPGPGGVYGGGVQYQYQGVPPQPPVVPEAGTGVVPEYSNGGPGVVYQGVPLLQPPLPPSMVSEVGSGVVPAYSSGEPDVQEGGSSSLPTQLTMPFCI